MLDISVVILIGSDNFVLMRKVLTASPKIRRYDRENYDRPVAGIVVALTCRSGRAATG